MIKNFQTLISTFTNSIKTWDYFVKWDKVFTNTSALEITLNKLNYLLGKQNLREEFITLYTSNPDIVKALPILVAVRDSRLEIYDKISKSSEYYDFMGTEENPEKYVDFIEKSGLSKLFQSDGIKNLVDYVIGIEVGLDSNGRKNRGGVLMEEIVKSFLNDFCIKHDLEYLSQSNARKIRNTWGVNINVNISSRTFDFALYNPKSKKVKLFEVNFYNGGGSKLKTVCGEFRNLYTELKSQDIDFIWVTDGLGWHTALRPLEETFNHNEYVFNLKMLEEGILDTLTW